MRLVNLLLLFYITCIGQSAIAQYSTAADYENEFTVGVNTNTNGGLISGFNIKYQRKKTKKKYDLYSLEIVNVRHEKEVRLTSANSSPFFVGKLNHLFAIRPSYGKELVLFNKYQENGVRINLNLSGGPTLGLLKPYFIEYITNTNTGTTETVAYDPEVHDEISLIDGDAGMFYGMNQAKPKLGIHARTALNFEYGPFPDMMLGLELGTTFEAFASEIILNQNMENRQLYPAMFLHLYYGYRF